MLYVSDLDFTLLKSDTTLSQKSVECWNLASKSNKLTIATARSLTGVKELLKGLTLKEPLILLDGVMIADINGDILHLSSINKELGDEILNIAKKYLNLEPLIVAFEDGFEYFLYPKKLNNYQKELLSSMKLRNRIIVDNLKAKDNNLKIVFQANKDDANALSKLLKDRFGSNIEIKSSKDPYIDCYFITILNPKGDKAHALKKLEEIEDVSFKNTTVFGDSYNDIGMFKVASDKIAVANAIDELKEIATEVLEYSNDEDGVARYLNKRLNLGVDFG